MVFSAASFSPIKPPANAPINAPTGPPTMPPTTAPAPRPMAVSFGVSCFVLLAASAKGVAVRADVMTAAIINFFHGLIL